MSLIQSLLHAVRSWRRRRGAKAKAPQRSHVALEQLDHRQLLAVNFTGNVAIDFPETLQPGVVVLRGPGDGGRPVIHPMIPAPLQGVIPVSGFDINAIRVSYTPNDDTLSIGIEQPPANPSDPNSLPVIAGDADDNGNSATVNPAVLVIDPGFEDAANFGFSETMAAFVNFFPDQTNHADLVAGFSNNPAVAVKQYQVADAIVNGNGPPLFGAPRPQNTGSFFLFNSPATPAFEFNISHFSQVYQEKTGLPFTPTSRIAIGAFGGANEGGISEAFFPSKSVAIGSITNNQCPACPPLNPPVIVNIHENRHVNTAHPEKVRAYVFGTSGFNVRDINQGSVRLGAPNQSQQAGAVPFDHLFRDVNRDGFLDETFFFRGNDIKGLPPGFTQIELSGQLNNGTQFVSESNIFNKDASFYAPAQLAAAQARQQAREVAFERVQARRDGGVGVASAPKPAATGPVVQIRARHGRRVTQQSATNTVHIPGVSSTVPTVPVSTATGSMSM